VVFPRLMNIYGIHFYHYAPVYILSFATSVDAAAANSGTWVSRTAPTLNNPDWYGSINAVTWEGIKAVRFQLGDNDQINSWHLYGEPAADPTDSLILRKTASDTPLDDDYWHLGIIGRGSVLYREFRVKNPTALTAQDPVVSAASLTDPSPAIDSGFEFSTDLTSWAATRTLPDIAPGGISAPVYCRITIPANAAFQSAAVTVKAKEASFT
jgi:hypothetical protein